MGKPVHFFHIQHSDGLILLLAVLVPPFIYKHPYRSLERDSVKVLIGDNLAAHLSPYVISMCELHNVRFIFLPENSTHLLQPLDVSVFAPLKKAWREILTRWKNDCRAMGEEYGTLPKKIFPVLLNQLMQRDFHTAIVSGFEATGIFPFSVERAVHRLPQESADVESDVQRQLIRQLEMMRYGPVTQARAPRPKKSQKLPAGTSYTCRPSGDAGGDSDTDNNLSPDGDTTGRRAEKRTRPMAEEDSDSSVYSSISDQVEGIIGSLSKSLPQEPATRRQHSPFADARADDQDDGEHTEEEEEEQHGVSDQVCLVD